MVTINYDTRVINGAKAARSDHAFKVYDESGYEIYHVDNIWNEEWDRITIQNGEWLNLSNMPTEEDVLRSEVSYLTMMNDYLESELEQKTADIDYCLMLLEG